MTLPTEVVLVLVTSAFTGGGLLAGFRWQGRRTETAVKAIRADLEEVQSELQGASSAVATIKNELLGMSGRDGLIARVRQLEEWREEVRDDISEIKGMLARDPR